MSSVLSKIKKLEEYIASSDASSTDRVLELTIDKLLRREASRLASQKAGLEQQLAEFERKYRLDSAEFYERFERGEMGDATDFIEWSATYEMVRELERQLLVLKQFVANRNLMEVHDLDNEKEQCRIDEIVQAGHAVVFTPDTLEQAHREGYDNCAYCLGHSVR